VRQLGLSDLYWLTDEQMARLQPYFPRSHGKPRADDRRVLSGIIFVNRHGLRWRDAPKGTVKLTRIWFACLECGSIPIMGREHIMIGSQAIA
jgi:transposase